MNLHKFKIFYNCILSLIKTQLIKRNIYKEYKHNKNFDLHKMKTEVEYKQFNKLLN